MWSFSDFSITFGYIVNLTFNFLYVYVHICAHAHMHVGIHMWVQVLVAARRGCRSPVAQVRGGCEPTDMAVMDWTGILWKISIHYMYQLILSPCKLDRREMKTQRGWSYKARALKSLNSFPALCSPTFDDRWGNRPMFLIWNH